MSRTSLPFFAGDISALARSLGGQLAQGDHAPSHLELLNMLARSAGCRNFQHWRTQAGVGGQADRSRPAMEPVDPVRTRRIARYFDGEGRLIRWPGKFSHREPCLWVLWSKLPPRRPLTEPQINQLLQDAHLFGDHALLRRELCDNGLAARTADCREYRRIERRPPPDALALMDCLRANRTS